MISEPLIDRWQNLAVVFSYEQASAIYQDNWRVVFLCIDIPKCQYEASLAGAKKFFEKSLTKK